MTREEQIRNAADEHFAHSWRGSVMDAFTEGAQWADQHLKDNLVDIDKACEWFREQSFGGWIEQPDDEFIEEFVKEMKGE